MIAACVPLFVLLTSYDPTIMGDHESEIRINVCTIATIQTYTSKYDKGCLLTISGNLGGWRVKESCPEVELLVNKKVSGQ